MSAGAPLILLYFDLLNQPPPLPLPLSFGLRTPHVRRLLLPQAACRLIGRPGDDTFPTPSSSIPNLLSGSCLAGCLLIQNRDQVEQGEAQELVEVQPRPFPGIAPRHGRGRQVTVSLGVLHQW